MLLLPSHPRQKSTGFCSQSVDQFSGGVSAVQDYGAGLGSTEWAAVRRRDVEQFLEQRMHVYWNKQIASTEDGMLRSLEAGPLFPRL